MTHQRTIKFVISLLVCLELVGCQNTLQFREGKQLLSEGRIEESLVKFQEASRLEPNNGEYRSAYVTTRERAIYLWLDQADRARSAGRAAEAEQLYNRVLALDPANARAKAAIEETARVRRHVDLMDQAQAAWRVNDSTTALARLRAILGENPKHREAAELRRNIEERIAKAPFDIKLAAALKKPISIEFRDTPIKQVFEVFARTSGLNFVFDKDVRSDLRTTIFLRNTTIQDAVSMVVLTNQLEQRILDSNTILIYPNTPAKAREYQPLVVRTFFLNNADVKVAATTIRTIVKTRDLIIDEKQNMIIMRDTPEAVRLAERLMALHDLPEPEVMLEVEILEVKRTRLLDLGINWPGQLALTPLSTTGGTTVTLADLKNISSATLGATLAPAVINLRKEDGDANLLANPRIRSRNREKARILVGDRVPNITTTATSTGFVSESVTYVDVGLKLEVEPTVYMDDEVAIKIALEVSNIVNQIQTRSGSVAYQIGTRNANSVLRLKDGENQVLAGLINDEDRRLGSKVPGLGDLPIVGRLFGSQRDDAQKTEIVLSITPRILRNPARPRLSDAEFDAGTEASLRNRGFEGGGAAPPLFKPPITVPVVPTAPAGPGAASPTPLPGQTSGPGTTPTPGPGGAYPPDATGGTAMPGFGQPGASAPVGDPSATGGVAGTFVGAPAVTGPSAFTTGGTTFAFQGPTQAAIGSSFTLSLLIQPDQPVTSIPFAIGYDPRLLEITAVTEGDFMRQGGAASTFTSRVDAAQGRVFATATRGSAGGAATTGILATLTIRALAEAGSASVQLVAASPIGVGGSSVSTVTPAPYTLAIVR